MTLNVVAKPSTLCSLIACSWMMLLSGCAEFPAHIQRGDETTIASYTAYAWAPDGPYTKNQKIESAQLSAENSQLIQKAVERRLDDLGYEKDPNRSSADFLVFVVTGTRDRFQDKDFLHPESPFDDQPVFPDQGPIDTYTEGRLAIGVVDRATGRVLWQGSTYKRITDEVRDTLPIQINRAIRSILDEFPPRNAT